MSESLLRLPQVEERTGLRRSAIYGRVARGHFPRPIKLTDKAVAWPESEIQQWIEDRIRKSREPTGGAA